MKKVKLTEEDYPLVKARYGEEFDKKTVSMIHRKYPDVDFEYRAIVFHLGDSNVIYYTLEEKGKKTRGVEVYSGRNYVVNSNRKSYSRHYDVNNIPIKYKRYIRYLKSIHSKTKWSEELRVDINRDLV